MKKCTRCQDVDAIAYVLELREAYNPDEYRSYYSINNIPPLCKKCAAEFDEVLAALLRLQGFSGAVSK